MDLARSIRNHLTRLPLSAPLKIFLFGFPSWDAGRNDDAGFPAGGRTAEASVPAQGYAGMTPVLEAWALDAVRRHPDFSLDDLIQGSAFHKKQVINYFQYYRKEDFRTWKTRLKIGVVQQRLLDELTGISRIAADLGFYDRSNFNRQFKKLAGCTPRQWRETGGHPHLN